MLRNQDVISTQMKKTRFLILGPLLLALLGCPKPYGNHEGEKVKDCTATITFEEVIVIRDTDPNIGDTWQLEASIAPQFPPMPQAGAFVPIIPQATPGDQGMRLIQRGAAGIPPPFQFGPLVLGPKGQRYDIIISTRGNEIDPPGAGGNDSDPLGVQQFELRQLFCPSDTQVRYKYKQAFTDAATGEVGVLEYTIQVFLDP